MQFQKEFVYLHRQTIRSGGNTVNSAKKIMNTISNNIKTNGRIEYYNRYTKRIAATMARCIGDKKWHQVSCQEFLTDFSVIEDRLSEIGELNTYEA